MTLVVVDVESDGPIPNVYSMVCFGAVIVEDGLTKTFYGKTKPISHKFQAEALSISGISREEHMTFDDPKEVMLEFKNWLSENCKNPVFISDNPAFDWQWINYYFHYFTGSNPFGFSARRIGDIYCGMKNNLTLNSEWKKLYRKTTHDHNPVNDAKGNAEALLKFKEMGLVFNKQIEPFEPVVTMFPSNIKYPQ